MSDFIREVDEEVRRDRIIRFWQKYWILIIGLAVLIVLASGAWEVWQYRQRRQTEKASAKYDAALALVTAGKPAEAKPAFDRLARSHNGYRDLARLMAADAAARGNAAAGIKDYDALAADTTLTPLMRDLARLRAGLLVVDSGDAKALQLRLEPLAGANGVFRQTARELLALAAIKRNDVTTATRWLSAILGDPSAPSEIRDRAAGYLGIVQGMKPAPGS